jgi:hypothetical protein
MKAHTRIAADCGMPAKKGKLAHLGNTYDCAVIDVSNRKELIESFTASYLKYYATGIQTKHAIEETLSDLGFIPRKDRLPCSVIGRKLAVGLKANAAGITSHEYLERQQHSGKARRKTREERDAESILDQERQRQTAKAQPAAQPKAKRSHHKAKAKPQEEANAGTGESGNREGAGGVIYSPSLVAAASSA